MIKYRNHIYREATTKDVVVDLINAWVDSGVGRKIYATPPDRELRYEASKALQEYLGKSKEPEIGDTITAWRGTHREQEYEDVKAGLQIKSKNYADNIMEKGMSVAMTPATIWAYNYDWAYKVKGKVADFGSDGEPVLVDVHVASPLFTDEEVIAYDLSEGATAKKREKILELVNLTKASRDDLLWLGGDDPTRLMRV